MLRIYERSLAGISVGNILTVNGASIYYFVRSKKGDA